MKKSGYRRTYTVTAKTVGTGRDGFCYSARPVKLNQSATRSFGGDASGVLAGTQGDLDCSKDGRLDQTACPPLNP